jgi:hypothetical protein
MIGKKLRLLGLAIGLSVALPALAQLGYPAKGSWSGYWGPDKNDRHRMLLVMDWVNDKIVGKINPGMDDGGKITSAKLDPSTWTLTIQAELGMNGKDPKHFVATGKLSNLGSWTNRRYTGTYHYGNETGSFMVIRN